MAQVSLPKRYKDLDLLFTAHPVRKDVNILTDDNAVITSVRNLLFTNYYDRKTIGSGYSLINANKLHEINLLISYGFN